MRALLLASALLAVTIPLAGCAAPEDAVGPDCPTPTSNLTTNTTGHNEAQECPQSTGANDSTANGTA